MLRDLRRCFAPLAAYELLFKIVTVAVLAPFSAWLLTSLIAPTGKAAVSNYELVSFACSLRGIVSLVAMGTVGLAITFAEQAGLMCIAWSAMQGKRPSTLGAVWYTARRVPDLVRLALLQVAANLSCSLPFVVIAAMTYVTLLTDHDLNFYLARRPPRFLLAVAIGAVCLLGLLVVWAGLYIRWLFALPACLLRAGGSVSAVRESWRLTGDGMWRIAALMGAWFVTITVLGGVAAVSLRFVEGMLLRAVGQRLGLLLVVLAALMVVNLAATLLVSLVGLTTHCLLVMRLYHASLAGCRESVAVAEEAGRAAPPPRVAWLSRKRFVFSAAFIFTLATTTSAWLLVEAIQIEDTVAVTAHRGSSRAAPENSLSAVRRAIEEGADYAEIDVQATADGVIVLLHDEDLMRVAGVDKKIWELSYGEIKDLDAGSWFSPEFRGEPIPTLAGVIGAARGRIKLNVELKLHGNDQRLCQGVVELLRREQFESQCVISSLDYQALVETKRLDERLRVGYIVSASIGDITKLDVDFLSLNAARVDRELVDRAHARGQELHVWTVNDRSAMTAMIDLGVDNIITDVPEVLVGVRAERAGLSNSERILLGFRRWIVP